MTDYKKWERFNEEEVLLQQEQREEAMAVKDVRRKAVKEQAKLQEELTLQTKRQAEAVKSKVKLDYALIITIHCVR